ncbi:MAG: hypothetical protein P3W94_004905 [Paracoccus sp. (in: a-proteobacteria)]|nr:hypothetical protein [Paracoccus sp. (in: a-proteobacteria)]
MIGAGLLAILTVLGGDPAMAETSLLGALRRDADEWLLSGRGLPPGYRLRLMQMEPAERMQALAYLRRLGLLTGPSWPVEDLLKPVTATKPEVQK